MDETKWERVIDNASVISDPASMNSLHHFKTVESTSDFAEWWPNTANAIVSALYNNSDSRKSVVHILQAALEDVADISSVNKD